MESRRNSVKMRLRKVEIKMKSTEVLNPQCHSINTESQDIAKWAKEIHAA